MLKLLAIHEAIITNGLQTGRKCNFGKFFRAIEGGVAQHLQPGGQAYLPQKAAAQGLATCILGWLDDGKIREICDLQYPVRLVITLGYAAQGDTLRTKKRKALEELVAYK